MTKKKQNKNLWFIIPIVLIAIVAFAVFSISKYKATPNPNVVDNGVTIKAVIMDGNGKIKQELTNAPLKGDNSLRSIISSTGQTGYIALSPTSCTGGSCNFLGLIVHLNNLAGTTPVTINGVDGITTCNSANTNPLCSSVPNVLGPTSQTTTAKYGGLNAKYASTLPITLAKVTSGGQVTTDPISLDEVASALGNTPGLIDFSITATGTYPDSFGNPAPLTNVNGKLTLRVAPSACSDGTPADPTIATDDITYCQKVTTPPTPVKYTGKYCRVGANGIPTLTSRASFCGCPTGYLAKGEQCQSLKCTPDTCITGSINYCLADGKSVESRCNQCGGTSYANCPHDIYDNAANGCTPSTGNPSTCAYAPIQQNFGIQIDPPTITPITACGDGIKDATLGEQCDTNDYGECSCSSGTSVPCSLPSSFNSGTLGCDTTCHYVTTGCSNAYVKFRTLFSEITSTTNTNEIAYINMCGQSLVAFKQQNTLNGAKTGTCATAIPAMAAYVKKIDIPTGISSITYGTGLIATKNFALWTYGANYLLAGEDTSNHCIYIGFIVNSGTPVVDRSAIPSDATKESTCV
jgi:hypothetical protein